MRQSHVIGVVIIIAFVVFGIGAFKSAATRYVGFDEARKGNSAVQVMGNLDKASIQVDPKTHVLTFNISDDAGQVMPVVYNKPEPGNLRQAPKVVVTGRYDGKALVASNVLVKCPTKYQGQ